LECKDFPARFRCILEEILLSLVASPVGAAAAAVGFQEIPALLGALGLSPWGKL
jgi:hypothetical protein